MAEQTYAQRIKPRRRSFAERAARDLAQAMEHALDAEAMSARRGFLQGLDPRTKLIGIMALIASGVLSHSLLLLAGLFSVALALAALSHVITDRMIRHVWLSVLLFTGVIALPATVLVPGEPLWQLPLLGGTVTRQGLRSAAFLIARSELSATLALLLIVTTPWPHVLKALRSLGVPVVLVAVLGMTHRFIFLFLQTAEQLFEARRSRIVAAMSGAQQRQMAIVAAGTLLDKAIQLSGEVHLSMVSRGYRGEVHLLHEFRTRPRDWVTLSVALSSPLLVLWFQK